MMTETKFGSETIAATARKAAAAMPGLKDKLDAADSRLGDGDTGTMLLRVLSAIGEKAAAGSNSDVGEFLTSLARTAASATGSSLGTLLATALLSIGKATRGQEEVPYRDLAKLVEVGRTAMIARGGAALGDKTILDVLHSVEGALEGVENGADAAVKASDAAQAALSTFRDRPNRVGRARMFSEASVGLDDPGMLALAELLKALAAQEGQAT